MIIAAVIALLVVLVAIGERRWRAAGMDLDGNRVEESKNNECRRMDFYVAIARSRLGDERQGLLAFAWRTAREAGRVGNRSIARLPSRF